MSQKRTYCRTTSALLNAIFLLSLYSGFLSTKLATAAPRRGREETRENEIEKILKNLSFLRHLKHLYSSDTNELLNSFHTLELPIEEMDQLNQDVNKNTCQFSREGKNIKKPSKFIKPNSNTIPYNSIKFKRKKKKHKKIKENPIMFLEKEIVSNLKSKWFTKYLQSLPSKLKIEKCIENQPVAFLNNTRDVTSLTLRDGLKFMQLLEILKDLEVTKEEYNRIREENKKLIALNDKLKVYSNSEGLDDITDEPVEFDEIEESIDGKTSSILERLNKMIALLNESHLFDFPIEESKIRKNLGKKSTTGFTGSNPPITAPITTTTLDPGGTKGYVIAWQQFSKHHTIPARTTTQKHFSLPAKVSSISTTTSPTIAIGCPVDATKCPLCTGGGGFFPTLSCSTCTNTRVAKTERTPIAGTEKLVSVSTTLSPAEEDDFSEDLQHLYLFKYNQKNITKPISTQDGRSNVIPRDDFTFRSLTEEDNQILRTHEDPKEIIYNTPLLETIRVIGTNRDVKRSSKMKISFSKPILMYTEARDDLDLLTKEDEVPFDYFAEERRAPPRRSYSQRSFLLPDFNGRSYLDGPPDYDAESHADRPFLHFLSYLVVLQAMFF